MIVSDFCVRERTWALGFWTGSQCWVVGVGVEFSTDAPDVARMSLPRALDDLVVIENFFRVSERFELTCQSVLQTTQSHVRGHRPRRENASHAPHVVAGQQLKKIQASGVSRSGIGQIFYGVIVVINKRNRWTQ